MDVTAGSEHGDTRRPTTARGRALAAVTGAVRPGLDRLVGALPPAVGRPLRDARLRLSVRTGRGLVVPADRYEAFLVEHLPKVSRHGGQYLEFGVYLGSSIGAAVRAFDRAGCRGARFVGFDSFAGLPPGSEEEGWVSGQFASSRAVTEWHLRRQGIAERIELVEGWFADTCNADTVVAHDLRDVVVAMIDCDIHSATVTALDFVGPLLAERAIVIFDDWFALNPDGERLEGQRLACEAYRDRHPARRFAELGRVGYHGLAFLVEPAPVAEPR